MKPITKRMKDTSRIFRQDNSSSKCSTSLNNTVSKDALPKMKPSQLPSMRQSRNDYSTLAEPHAAPSHMEMAEKTDHILSLMSDRAHMPRNGKQNPYFSHHKRYLSQL